MVVPKVGHCKIFISLVKRRIEDNNLQTWNGAISNMIWGILYHHISCVRYPTCLDILTVDILFDQVSSHRLTI